FLVVENRRRNAHLASSLIGAQRNDHVCLLQCRSCGDGVPHQERYNRTLIFFGSDGGISQTWKLLLQTLCQGAHVRSNPIDAETMNVLQSFVLANTAKVAGRADFVPGSARRCAASSPQPGLQNRALQSLSYIQVAEASPHEPFVC